MIKMIDLHTHILPNIDDGPSSLEEALAMTELLWAQGVQAAVCTPHFYPYNIGLSDFLYLRREAMSLLKSSPIPLISASETYLHEYLLYYSNLDSLKIENTNYLLLELPFERKWRSDIFSLLEKLIIHYDLIPIIAHIERYPASRKSNIRKLKDLGCVMQLNTSSLLEKKLKGIAFNYIGEGLIDVLGSDCHNQKHRPPQIQVALEAIRMQLGYSYCTKMIQQSERVVMGIDIR